MEEGGIVAVVIGRYEDSVLLIFGVDVVDLFGEVVQAEEGVSDERKFLCSSGFLGLVEQRWVIVFASESVLPVGQFVIETTVESVQRTFCSVFLQFGSIFSFLQNGLFLLFGLECDLQSF